MIDVDDFLEWCETLFNEPAENMTMKTEQEELAGWDSTGTLLLMADLDEIHGIEVSEEDLDALKTLADIAELIKERGVVQD